MKGTIQAKRTCVLAFTMDNTLSPIQQKIVRVSGLLLLRRRPPVSVLYNCSVFGTDTTVTTVRIMGKAVFRRVLPVFVRRVQGLARGNDDSRQGLELLNMLPKAGRGLTPF